MRRRGASEPAPARASRVRARQTPPREAVLLRSIPVLLVAALLLLPGCAPEPNRAAPPPQPSALPAPTPPPMSPPGTPVLTPERSLAGLAPTQETAPLRALVSVPNGAWAVAVAPSLRRAYVTSRESDAVTFVDLDQNRVEQTVTIGPDPHNLVVDAAAGRLYVTLHGGTSALRGDAVAVLDATTGAVLAKWPTGPFPAQIDLDPNLGRLFVVNEGDSTITVLDTQSGAEVQRIGVAGSGTDVAVSPPTGRVYVTTWPARLLVTLDGRTGETLAQTPLGQMPLRIAVNPNTERVYVGDGTTPGADRGELWTVDGRTQVATSRRLGWLPLGIGVDPEGATVLATDARLGLLSVLDGTGQEIRWQGAVGAGPHTIVPSRALGRAYVVISATNTLGVLDWPLPAR